jgi:hypothetical protein
MTIARCALLIATITVVAGCSASGTSGEGGSQSARLAASRAKFVLATEPAGVLPISLAREDISPDHDVVLLGRIGGVAEPWQQGQAAFVMVDPAAAAAAGDSHACTDPGCPFCNKDRETDAESLALVQFVDEGGKVVPLDARELFAIESDQLVVVRGRASINELGHVVVAANGIFVRR